MENRFHIFVMPSPVDAGPGAVDDDDYYEYDRRRDEVQFHICLARVNNIKIKRRTGRLRIGA